VDSGQELLSCGLYNTLSSFFGCFVATQAPPRTLVNETAGGRTQMAGQSDRQLADIALLCRTTPTHLTAFVRDYPGEPVPER